jgi:hypothetical protein
MLRIVARRRLPHPSRSMLRIVARRRSPHPRAHGVFFRAPLPRLRALSTTLGAWRIAVGAGIC